MYREFIILPEFEKFLHNSGLTDRELRELQYFLCSYPEKGDVIPGTGGLRKLRWGFKEKGKRAGVRILYVDFPIFEKIYLITGFPKNVKIDLSQTEKKNIKELIKTLEEELKSR